MQHFHTTLLCQKPIFWQTEWGVQNGPITKNGVLSVTTFLFQKFCFSLGTLYIELIWFTNHPNVHIHAFQKCWSFTSGCFYPVSILKVDLNAAKIRNVQDYVHQKLIWMEVHIYSVKARSKAGNIQVKYTMTTQKSQNRKKIS